MKATPFFLGAIVGAGVQYFFDPLGGAKRRSMAADKAGKYAREAGEEVARKADYAAGVAKGAAVEATKAAKPAGDGADELNDPALANKVESEIFREADAPKGKVDVNVENRVVYLRGTVDPETAEKLVSDAQKVEGVERVESLLETAGKK
jgi:osmotically-inducible protein OsmY